MSRGRHARDGQRRDATRARARDTWTRAIVWLGGLGRFLPDRPAARLVLLALAALDRIDTPAPDWKPGQEKPRPADPPSGSGAVRAGATTTPGAVNADSGTRPGPAGTVPARQPEAGAPPAPAAAPAPPPPKAPGPGQHSPDRAAPAGQGDCRQALPATRGQRLGDLVILPGACAWDPDRSRISRLTAPAPCAETGAMEAAP